MEFLSNLFSEYQDIIISISIISGVLFIASIIFIPTFIKKMPVDYFINKSYHQIKINSFKDFIIFSIKNIIGFILVLAGIIMLFTPGQGIISIIIGLFLMQFKGKYKLEKKLINNDISFKALNWIRAKRNKPPFKR